MNKKGCSQVAVYDDQKQKTRSPSDDELRELTGISPDEERSMERSAGDDTAQDTAAEKEESDKLGESDQDNSDTDNSLYNDSDTGSRKKIPIKAKLLVGGGAGGLLGGSLLGLIIMSTGPLQFIHFAQLLQGFHFSMGNSIMEGRLTNYYRYLRFSDSPEQRRLGALGRNSASRVEASLRQRGLTPEWGTTAADRGRLTRLRVDPAHLPALRSSGLGPDIRLADGVYVIDIDPAGTHPREARGRLNEVRRVVGSMDVKVGPIGYRNLKTKAGIRLFNLSGRRIIQDLNAKRVAHNERRAEVIENNKVKQGRVNSTETQASEDTSRTGQDVEVRGDRAAVSSSVRRAATGVAGLGLVCAAYNILDGAEHIRKYNMVMPLMRTGARVVSIGSQVQSGEVDVDELRFLSEELFDENAPEEDSSWINARSIQAELEDGEATGPDIPDSAHPTRSRNTILQHFAEMPEVIASGADSVCGAVTSTVGIVAGYAFDFFTGGASAVAKTAATELVLGHFTDDIVDILAGEEVPTDPTGADLGNYANYGAKLTAEENMISHGARELDSEESLAWENYLKEQERIENSQKSFFARTLNIYDANSLVARASRSTPSSAPQLIASIFSSPLALVSSMITPAQAQNNYDYGIPEFGFSMDELNNPAYQNPFENEEIVQPLLDDQDTADRIEKCFGMKLNGDGSLTSIEDEVRVLDESTRQDGNCDDRSENWTRIRFYVLDMMVGTSLACYEGDAQSCQLLDSGGSTAPTQTGSGQPIEGSLDNVDCPDNMEENPEAEGYYKMPEAPNGEYSIYAEDFKRYGSRELVCAIYSVALAYNEAMNGTSKLTIGNLNTPLGAPSQSHRWGVGNDHSGAGEVFAANWVNTDNYDDEATITLGKLWVDTGMLKNIWWCPPDAANEGAEGNNGRSQNEIRQYAESQGESINIYCISGHRDHFHVDLKDEFRLQEYL